MVKNLKELEKEMIEIKKMEYLAIDLEFVPSIVIGEESAVSLIQVAGFSRKNEEEGREDISPKIWVFDILPSNEIFSPSGECFEDNLKEVGEMTAVIVKEIFGGVGCIKLGIGLEDDLKKLKAVCEYDENTKLVRKLIEIHPPKIFIFPLYNFFIFPL